MPARVGPVETARGRVVLARNAIVRDSKRVLDHAANGSTRGTDGSVRVHGVHCILTVCRHRPGKGKGRFRLKKGFDEPLPEEVLALFEGRST